jgi:hypothetical protein
LRCGHGMTAVQTTTQVPALLHVCMGIIPGIFTYTMSLVSEAGFGFSSALVPTEALPVFLGFEECLCCQRSLAGMLLLQSLSPS